MNSGLISGPVQAAKNGRWRKWELTVQPHIYGMDDSFTINVNSSPPTKVRVVPIPSYVRVVRVTATAGGVFYSGSACKNVLMAVTHGRRFVVQLAEGGAVWFGTLRKEQELAQTFAAVNLDISVLLLSSSFAVYRRGDQMIQLSGGGTPALIPFLGGALVTGYNSAPANTPNPLDPQARSPSSGNVSLLFSGPIGGVPGARNSATVSPITGQSGPSYICVEWME